MRREPPVRFREGLGVTFPRATRLVMGFAGEEDARRVRDVVPKRLGKYGLTVHPEKTRLVEFQPPESRSPRGGPGAGSFPESFDFLGFTHDGGRSGKGDWAIRQKTAGGRFQRAIRKIKPWCRLNRHEPVEEPCQTLSQKLRGPFVHYGGVTGNVGSLKRFRHDVVRRWPRWLSRRKRRGPFAGSRMKRWIDQLPFPPRTASPVATNP